MFQASHNSIRQVFFNGVSNWKSVHNDCDWEGSGSGLQPYYSTTYNPVFLKTIHVHLYFMSPTKINRMSYAGY